MFFFTISFNLIIPELNSFISNLGGAEWKGLVIALFTISAAVSRPFSGKLSDHIGRRKVMVIGIVVAACVCLLYPLSFSVWFFLLLRFLHGFSNGFYPTGATALITDVLPEKQRGAGMGMFGLFISLGIGVGQGLSSIVADLVETQGMFFGAAIFSAIAFFLLLRVKETLPNPSAFTPRMLAIRSDEIVERNVLPVAIVMFLTATCSGIVFVLTSEMAGFLGIANKGWFFLWYVISTIGVRLFTGQLSDKIGRRQTLLISVVLLIASMVLIGLSTNVLWFTLSAVLFGIATGTSSPTVFAWTADLSPDHRRGIGAGTMFIALELGIFAGSVMTNMLYTNDPGSVLTVFLFGAAMAGLAGLYLVWHLLRKESAT